MDHDMQICIPSRSRPLNQKTIKGLSEELWPYITLVVPFDQYIQYRQVTPMDVKILPFDGFGIAAKRQFMLRLKESGKILMLDDDLKFYRRIEDGSRFLPTKPEQTVEMINNICTLLGKYTMVGLADKFMSQSLPRGHIECHRFNQTLCFNRDRFPKPWPEFRGLIAEEHDIMLQLITRGHKTAIITEYSKVDRPYSKGGCSDWRTTEIMMSEIERMAQLWPGIVTYTEYPARKDGTRHPQGYKVRFDWKAAVRQGEEYVHAHHNSNQGSNQPTTDTQPTPK